MALARLGIEAWAGQRQDREFCRSITQIDLCFSWGLDQPATLAAWALPCRPWS